MQHILSEESWQLLRTDIEKLMALNIQLKQDNQRLLADKRQLLHLLTATEQRLTPVLEQLLSQQDDPT
ncbi:MAG: hypothetical protein AB1717_07325 [Pseudomonadota bacterium]